MGKDNNTAATKTYAALRAAGMFPSHQGNRFGAVIERPQLAAAERIVAAHGFRLVADQVPTTYLVLPRTTECTCTDSMLDDDDRCSDCGLRPAGF